MLALAPAGCAGPRLREIEVAEAAKLRSWCAVTDPPVSREQARCIAGAAGIARDEAAYTVEEGADLQREPIWVVRERCEVIPRCVEIWIRQSDGAIVNTRWLYVFDGGADATARP